jgi:integrase/recombinase XerD
MRIDTSVEGFKAYMVGVRTPATADKYSRCVRMFLNVIADDNYKNVDDLPPNILSQYAVALKNKGYGQSSIHTQVYAVQRYLNWIRGQGANVPNLAPADLPTIQFRVKEILDPEQVQTYFNLADSLLDEPVRTAVMFAPCCGLRAQELCKLQLTNIRRGQVQFGDSKKDTLLLQVIGKGGKERVVPLMDEGTQLLTAYLGGWRRSASGPWVFPAGHTSTLSAKPLHERTLRNGMIRVRDPMKLDFTPHTMRRTYLTLLWRRGVPEAVLAKIAGHKDIGTLLRHYLALDEDDIMRKFHNAEGGSRLLT